MIDAYSMEMGKAVITFKEPVARIHNFKVIKLKTFLSIKNDFDNITDSFGVTHMIVFLIKKILNALCKMIKDLENTN